MLHADSYENIQTNYKEDSDLESKENKVKDKNQPVYFMSLVCNPKILEDPHSTKERFSINLWANKEIKSIKQMPQYLEISVNEKKHRKSCKASEIYKNQINNDYNLADGQLQKELIHAQNSYYTDYPLLKKLQGEKTHLNREHEFDKWVKSMSGKNFVGFFVPLREEGPKFRKLVMSKPTLKMLGYEPEEFSIQMEKYTQLAADFWSNYAYKTIFLNYITSFRKFMSMEVRGDITHEECVKESAITIMNQMRGKNQASVKVEMKMYLPNMFTICYELLRVVQSRQFRDHQMNEYRNSLLFQSNKTTYNSLSSITKLPKDINPANSNKICSYIVIREPSFIYDSSSSKEQGSGSEYQLSQSL